tara:strand:- start:142 stop:522 length:381 start_codon:yes stop_codon:yes gene_type:complete
MNNTLGIRHIALKVRKFKECLRFYNVILKMEIDWQPDDENVYLTNTKDNLALHFDDSIDLSSQSRLDHFGILLQKKEDVDVWYNYILENKVEIFKPVSDHRDGSRSFYCYDPDGNIVQLIWHPKIS